MSSGSLESVKRLVDAGTKVNAVDKIYNGTPLGCAIYLQNEDSRDEREKKNFALIEAYFLGIRIMYSALKSFPVKMNFHFWVFIFGIFLSTRLETTPLHI